RETSLAPSPRDDDGLALLPRGLLQQGEVLPVQTGHLGVNPDGALLEQHGQVDPASVGWLWSLSCRAGWSCWRRSGTLASISTEAQNLLHPGSGFRNQLGKATVGAWER